ncbi:hypothetical protein [Thermosyntropha sp.]|nr:hypothetical protein [Thermosyntropha sp.]
MQRERDEHLARFVDEAVKGIEESLTKNKSQKTGILKKIFKKSK